jgi:hypothetical protein
MSFLQGSVQIVAVFEKNVLREIHPLSVKF